MPREKSTLWEMIFRKLWEDRITKEHVAKELYIPSGELYGLIFNLIDNPVDKQIIKSKDIPSLRLA